MDFAQRLVVNPRDQEWMPDPGSDAERKPFDELTCLMRLAPGGVVDFEDSRGVECFVLEGSVSHHSDVFEVGTYVRLPPGTARPLRSEDGCTFFLKRQPFAPGDRGCIVKRTLQTPWLPGQGRLEVMPLHEKEGRSAALVKWPAGERFVPHRHWGGEEILVLSGTFMDEHGNYAAGSWLRNPHLSEHHPFVEDETIILVKVGHLV